jgi:predicted nucleic acid-binding Zn ribbon protein
MGATIIAYAGIGIVIDTAMLDTVIVPSCEHEERIGNRFCPVCGTAVKEQETIDDDAFQSFVEAMEYDRNIPKGFVFTTLDVYENTQYFFGWGDSAGRYNRGMNTFRPLPEGDFVSDIKATIDTLMEEWNVPYDPNTFGLHVVQYYS